MGDPSRVGEARRYAADLAQRLDFDAIQRGRLAVAVNELGNNLLRHARGGRLLLAARAMDGGVAIELLSIDDGPGMGDLQACMRDGFSTGGSAGQGLGAVQRLADDFDIHTRAGEGTLILARFFRDRDAGGGPVRHRNGFEVGAICVPAPGEQVSGDGWDVAVVESRVDLVMADGLGHGPDAAEAAMAALAAFDSERGALPGNYVERSHAALRGTRGAAVGALRLDAAAGRIRFAGAGNIIGRVISGVADRTLLTQSGTAGLQMRSVQEQELEWPPHAQVILHSDGVQSRWQLADPGVLQRDPALVAAYVFWKFSRGRDDATVVVVRRTDN
ncbi:ATP-binding SpoIIE family protein phosphatase [Cupriavidus agavae]|uniref:Anti-sigma regulatory factor (Ser/Thr protein kinase) n=1 Tax=Cupriavidus agavae TaxID=1001822 RepID=A0A4V2FI14_9BURK|nr:ATP-binding SpoIIE family protein phosphatase [Cupriavidus agavae]RZT42189.1 anti-sigma regulatory factor (Ser/Thr protein kinase) [Cupriavidus agavae]